MTKNSFHVVLFITWALLSVGWIDAQAEETTSSVAQNIPDQNLNSDKSSSSQDDLDWKVASDKHTAESYEEYLEKNSSGLHKTSAIEKLVDIAEEIILKKKSKMADDDIKKVCHLLEKADENGDPRGKEYLESFSACSENKKGFFFNLFN